MYYSNPITPVADIIGHGYIRRKKIIFTTNIVLAKLCSRYGERIADRMNEDYAFIMYSNHPSYREHYGKDQEDLTLSPGRPDEVSEDLLHSGRKDHDCRKEKLAEKRQEGTLF